MFDVLMNLVFNTTSTADLTDKQILAITWGSTAITVFAFVMISLVFYKLMLYIVKF